MERSPSSFPAGVNLAYTQQKCAKLWQKYAKNFLEKGHNPHPRPHLQWRGYPLPISVFLGTSVLRTSIYRPTPTILLDTPMGCNHPVRHWLLVTSHLQEISQDLFIICPIAIAYHGIDYKITCVISVYVCMYACVCPCSHGRNFEPISTKFGTDVRNLKRKNPFVGGQNPLTVSAIFTQFYPKLAPT